ncbi:S-adenosyl-L-methionine-dependent methyltransferase [Parasitella parasitica]|nr:S-adenosyl-L-methionine-dependent methyltransferase [Parasitella parasitica]
MEFSSNQITCSEYKVVFEWKSGRRLAAQDDVAYILPSDQKEVIRLKLNHKLWKGILGGLFKSPLHEKLTEGIRVLDVGCGPGWWTLDMARLYPNSEFVGIDMADVFIIEDIPSNVKFQILNAGTGLDYFRDESFDFVFQRFLVMALPTEQYIRSVEEMKRLLKPGGAIEILELVNEYTNAGPAFKKINNWINEALAARNMDSYVADKISTYLANTGYQDIKDIGYHVPIGAWGGDPGELFLDIQRLALPAVKVMITELVSVSPQEYDDNMEEAFKEVNQYTISTRFRLVYARK